MRPNIVPKLVNDEKYSRIRELIGPMLREAIPAEMKEHLLNTDVLEPEETLLYIHKRCGPGGPEERAALLKSLVNPVELNKEGEKKTPLTYAYAAKALRIWMQKLKRAKDLQLSVPDPSLLWLAILEITVKVFSHDEQLSRAVSTGHRYLYLGGVGNVHV